MYTKEQLIAALSDEESMSELRRIIRQARREGGLGELGQAMIDVVFSEPELWEQVGSPLEKLVLGELELNLPSTSPDADVEAYSPGLTSTSPVPRETTFEALAWTSEMLEDELAEAGNGERAAQRRHALWQIQSVLKYAAGDQIGLVELSQYPEELTPVARWMLTAIARSKDRPAYPSDSFLPRLIGVRA